MVLFSHKTKINFYLTKAFALPPAKASLGVMEMSVYITGVVVMENIVLYNIIV